MTTPKRRRWLDALVAPPPLLPAGTTIGEAARLLGQSTLDAVFLRNEQGEIGLLTEGLVRLALHHGLQRAIASDLMEGADTAIPVGAPLSQAALAFARSAAAWLPVVDGAVFVGVIASKEILTALAQSRKGKTPPTRVASLDGMSARVLDVLSLVGQEAHRLGARAFLIGGAVRDCLLARCRQTPDLDLAVEGDAAALARAIGHRSAAETTVHGRFGTATLVFSLDGLELNLARTRTETYAHPGALPVVRAATLVQDLARRDFTVNSMAVSLDPRSFGRLEDPFGGVEDVALGCLRALHPLSFVEDPTRILRGARLAARLGFEPSPQMTRLTAVALKLGALARVSGDRIMAELARAFDEPDPPKVFELLSRWGVLAALQPSLTLGPERLAVLRRLDEALARIALVTRDLTVERAAAFLIVLTEGVPAEERKKWLGRLGLSGAPRQAILSASEKLGPVLARLSGGERLSPSGLKRLLDDLSPEALAACHASAADERAREAVEHYLGRIRSVRSMLTGKDLKAKGYPPGPSYSTILQALLDARLDGLVVTREDEERFVEERFPR